RLLKSSGCGGFRALIIWTVSAAHRGGLRRIVENSGSSAYAKSSAFSSGFLGHILRIIHRLAIVRGNLVLPRMPRIFWQNVSYQRPCPRILVRRLQPAFTIARRSDLRQNRSSASSMISVGRSRSTVRYTLGPVGSTLTNGFGTRKRRTPSSVLLPESGSTEISAKIGECAAPSCAHAVIVHNAVATTASRRSTMYLLIFVMIF